MTAAATDCILTYSLGDRHGRREPLTAPSAARSAVNTPPCGSNLFARSCGLFWLPDRLGYAAYTFRPSESSPLAPPSCRPADPRLPQHPTLVSVSKGTRFLILAGADHYVRPSTPSGMPDPNRNRTFSSGNSHPLRTRSCRRRLRTCRDTPRCRTQIQATTASLSDVAGYRVFAPVFTYKRPRSHEFGVVPIPIPEDPAAAPSVVVPFSFGTSTLSVFHTRAAVTRSATTLP